MTHLGHLIAGCCWLVGSAGWVASAWLAARSGRREFANIYLGLGSLGAAVALLNLMGA